MLRNIGKQSEKSVESVLKKKWKATVRRICRKKILNLKWRSEGVMDDENGELIKPMGKVSLTGLSDTE